MPRLLVYVMVSDTGKAPNISKNGHVCTLARCKKQTIVRSARKDDWIVGIGGKTLSKKCKRDYNRNLIYAMKVEDVVEPPKSKHFTHYGDTAKPLKGFKDITDVKRTKYLKNESLYKKFDKYMNKRKIGKRGNYCCVAPCKASKC
jgi:hypothetical protein